MQIPLLQRAEHGACSTASACWSPRWRRACCRTCTCGKHENVLEVGAGSGYMAALLADRAAQRVLSLEIDPGLAAIGARQPAPPASRNVEVREADGAKAAGRAEPTFDVIVLSGSVAERPAGPAGSAQDRRPAGRHRRLRADDARPLRDPHRRRPTGDGAALGHGGAAAARISPSPRASISDAAPFMIDQVRPAELADWFARPIRARAPVVLDVREPWELQTASVTPDGFTLVTIPMNEIPARVGELDPGRAIACLCHHGARSQRVAAVPGARAASTQVANIAGGIDAWSAQRSPRAPLLSGPQPPRFSYPQGRVMPRCPASSSCGSARDRVRSGDRAAGPWPEPDRARTSRRAAYDATWQSAHGRSTTPTCAAPRRPRPASCRRSACRATPRPPHQELRPTPPV